MIQLDKIWDSDKLLWCGNGHSFAIAELFASIYTLKLGKISIAIKRNELGCFNDDWKTVLISQSGNIPFNKIDLLVTQMDNIGSHLTLNVPSSHNIIPWFDIKYFNNLVRRISSRLSIKTFEHKIELMPYIKKKPLLIFDSNSKPLRTFLENTKEKLPIIDISISEIQDIGHGIHQQIYNNEFEQIILCKNNNKDFADFKAWLSKLDKRFDEIYIKDLYSYNSYINNFLYLLDYLSVYLEAFNIDYLERKLPKEFDKLR